MMRPVAYCISVSPRCVSNGRWPADELPDTFRKCRFARPVARNILPRMSETTAPARTIRPRMAGSVLMLAALLAVIAGVGVAIASIVRKPDLEGILGGVFGGLLLALVIMGV